MRKTTLVSGAVVMAFALAACGGGNDDNAGSEGEGGGEASGEITVWIMEPGADVLAEIEKSAAAFEAENDGTTINLESVPWASGHDQFVTAIAGGDVPDLAELGNTWLLEFAEQGAMQPVEWPESEEFVPALADSAVIDGEAYGYPWYAGARALIYRTDIFEQLGLEAPETWDDVIAAGEQIAAEMPEITPIRTAGQYQHQYLPMIWGEGGNLATQDGDTWTPGWNTDEGKAALQTLKDLWDTGWSPEGAVDWTSVDARNDFQNGNTAMMIGGGWDLGLLLEGNPDLEGKVGTALFPAGSSGEHTSFAGGSHLGVFEEADNPELAKAFAEFLVTEEQVSAFTEANGFLPSTVAGVEAVVGDDELYGTFADQFMEHSRFYPIAGWWGLAEGDEDVYVNPVKALLRGDATVDETAEAIDSGLQEKIDS